jgi:hypothetical protein
LERLYRDAVKPTAPCLVIALLAAVAPARAGNEPEKAQRRLEEDVLPKIVLACGVPLSMSYDGASLRARNKDIGYDQTDGGNECDEPLRYLWYACRTDAARRRSRRPASRRSCARGRPGPWDR